MATTITVGGNTIDLSTVNHTNAADTNYIYIQVTGPLTDEQKQQLTELQVQIQRFEGSNTYVCRYEPSDLQPIRSLPFVQVANCFHRRWKASAQLKEILNRQENARVDIGLHKGASSSEAVAASQTFTSIPGIEQDSVETDHRQIRANLSNADALTLLEQIDDIQSIDFAPPTGLHNNLARAILGVDQVGGVSTFQGLKATSQTVCVADTGFDKGDPNNKHPAFQSCQVKLMASARKNPDLTNDPNGHGTHVAASVLGSGLSTGDPSFTGEIKGTAAGANLIVQSMLNASGGFTTPDNLYSGLFQEPFGLGARIHTNSWGYTWDWSFSPPYKYDKQTEQVDGFIFDHPDFIAVFSAGNDGHRGTPAQVGGVSAAKNSILVGASESGRPTSNGNSYDPQKKDRSDPGSVAYFSSRGPTVEGRIKPDVVGPGVAIYSALSRDAASKKAEFDNDYGPSKDPAWVNCSGTSMATPLVAGCVAVIREALLSKQVQPALPSVSAALVKALLIHYATELNGQHTAFVYQNNAISSVPVTYARAPDPNCGYGRVNVEAVLRAITNRNTANNFDDSKPAFTSINREEVFSIQAGRGRLKATLVWSDAAGEQIQNYLRLSFRSAAKGDTFADANGAYKGVRNNVQQIVWEDFPGGAVSVVVTSVQITKGPQPFAVVWSLG